MLPGCFFLLFLLPGKISPRPPVSLLFPRRTAAAGVCPASPADGLRAASSAPGLHGSPPSTSTYDALSADPAPSSSNQPAAGRLPAPHQRSGSRTQSNAPVPVALREEIRQARLRFWCFMPSRHNHPFPIITRLADCQLKFDWREPQLLCPGLSLQGPVVMRAARCTKWVLKKGPAAWSLELGEFREQKTAGPLF